MAAEVDQRPRQMQREPLVTKLDAPSPRSRPYADLAAELRELRRRSGQPYRVLSRTTGYSTSTLSAAAAGNRLPSEDVVLAYVRACGGDVDEWRARWKQARRAALAQREDPASAAPTPEPHEPSDLALVATPADLTVALNRLWYASGRASIRHLQARSGGTLGRTTIHDVLAGVRAKPEWNTVWELVRVLHVPSGDPDEAAWRAAWERARAWADAESRRFPSRTPVHSCDPVTLGVHPGLDEASPPPPYIERDIDGDFRAAISAAGKKGGFILLVGDEGAGKTRLAYEALRAEVPDFGLFPPASEEDFSILLPPRTVVWLDNIDQHLNWASLTPLAIQAMQNAAGPVIVIGTMCAKRYNGGLVQPGPAPREDQQRHQEVLNQASVFTLPAQLSAAELDRAQEKRDDPQIAVALVADPEPFRTLASGPHLARRWATACPYARALITAAADMRRAGIPGPLPRHLLRDAAICYLPPRYRMRAGYGWFSEAFAYATEPVPGGLAPLIPDSPGAGQRGTPAYQAAGYLLWLRESEEHQELAATAELMEDLTTLNFDGPAYLAFEDDLARYAAVIISRWPRPASASSTCQYTGRHRYLEHHPTLKQAMDTADGVRPRMRSELASGFWKQDGGDSLAASFIAMCRTDLEAADGESPDAGPGPESRRDLRDGQHYSRDGSAVLRIILGSHLRWNREVVGVTRKEAAGEIGIKEPELGRIELGRSPLPVATVLNLLSFYGASAQQYEELLALAEQANRPGWWHRYHDIVPGWHQAYAGLEKSAESIRLYEQQLIPDLLQTDEYASAIVSLRDYPPEDVRRHLEHLGEPRRRLKNKELTLWAVLDEAALRRTVDGADVQIRQLRHLREQLDKQPNLAVQIIPYDAGAYPVPVGFSVLRFAEPYLSDVVYAENLTSAVYIENQAETNDYLIAFERLTGVASHPKETAPILEEIIQDIARIRDRRGLRPSAEAAPVPRSDGSGRIR